MPGSFAEYILSGAEGLRTTCVNCLFHQPARKPMGTAPTDRWLEQLRATRVWKSVFRRGPARTNRTRSLAIFGNLFLHALPVKVREASLRVRATYYLGSISFFLLVILVLTGTLLMLYYHPAVPQAYLDMKDLRFVIGNGVFLRNLHRVAANL